jgi:hypothetical protein
MPDSAHAHDPDPGPQPEADPELPEEDQPWRSGGELPGE